MMIWNKIFNFQIFIQNRARVRRHQKIHLHSTSSARSAMTLTHNEEIFGDSLSSFSSSSQQGARGCESCEGEEKITNEEKFSLHFNFFFLLYSCSNNIRSHSHQETEQRICVLTQFRIKINWNRTEAPSMRARHTELKERKIERKKKTWKSFYLIFSIFYSLLLLVCVLLWMRKNFLSSSRAHCDLIRLKLFVSIGEVARRWSCCCRRRVKFNEILHVNYLIFLEFAARALIQRGLGWGGGCLLPPAHVHSIK